MNCNCPTASHLATCPTQRTSTLSQLRFETVDATLFPYIGAMPLEPIDLTDLVQEAETNTRLRLNAIDGVIEYTGERAMNDIGSPDLIPLESISHLIPLSGLKDVAYDGVAGGALLVFNIDTQKWEPQTVNDDAIVTVIGYNADGRLAKAEGTGGGGGGGGGTPPGNATYSIASITAILPDPSQYKQYSIMAQAETLTIGNPGVASDGKVLIFRINDDGTARGINWHSAFRGIAVTIPGATTANRVTYVGCVYNARDGKWDVLSVNRQA